MFMVSGTNIDVLFSFTNLYTTRINHLLHRVRDVFNDTKYVTVSKKYDFQIDEKSSS